jgi:hypothetical protein
MALPSPDHFKSKKELHAYVDSLISNRGICKSLKSYNLDEYNFFYKLFQRHPDKERKRTTEIVDIAIEPHTISRYVTIIILNDGTSDTISYVKCVKQKSQTFSEKIKSAYRVAVDDQIKSFKEQNHNPCEFCGKKNHIEVDHIYHFAQLVYDFKKLYPNEPTSLNKNEAQQDCFKEEDSEYKNKWAEYHKKYATLRILCQSCNSTREKWKAPPKQI